MTSMQPNEPGDGLPSWQALRADWVAAAPPDPLRLWRQVRVKRRRMMYVQILEVLLALLATFQLGRVLLHPRDGIWPGWLWSMLAVVWGSTLISAWLRRRLWRTPAMEPADMLRLTAQRARLGIRFAVGSAVSMPLFMLTTTPMFEHMWAIAGTAERHRLMLSVVFNSAVGVVALVTSVWYFRRQRRRLRRVSALLEQLGE